MHVWINLLQKPAGSMWMKTMMEIDGESEDDHCDDEENEDISDDEEEDDERTVEIECSR